MTDPLSERLEKELKPAVRNYCGSEDCRPLLKLMIEAVLPILRDEIAAIKWDGAREEYLLWIQGLDGKLEPTHRVAMDLARHDAAVRERMLEEVCPLLCVWCRESKSPAHAGRYGGYYHFSGEYEENKCGASEIRALKTLQPEVSK